MDKENNSIDFLSDLSITDMEQDELGREEFVQAIADVIHDQSTKVNESKQEGVRNVDENMILGIYGQWGFGKSSILNMLGKQLEQKGIKTILFNPWIYGSENQIIASLFNAIVTATGADKDDQFDKKKLTTLFKNYYKLVSTFSPNVGTAMSSLVDLIGKEDSELDALQIKTQINIILRKTANPITIFIDDVDRLTREEIQTLFKTLRLIASFEHVIYVVACDDEMVAKSIKDNYVDGNIEDGKAFMEKIIQIPIHIPEIQSDKLIEFATKYVKQSINVDLTENGILKKIFRSYFRTPRDVKRFINGFRFTHSFFKHSIEEFPLLLMELVKSKMPDLFEIFKIYYRAIRQDHTDHYYAIEMYNHLKKFHPEMFITDPKSGQLGLHESDSKLKEFTEIFNVLFGTINDLRSLSFETTTMHIERNFNFEKMYNNQNWHGIKNFKNPDLVVSYFERTLNEEEGIQQ